jgi:hypothetical protein
MELADGSNALCHAESKHETISGSLGISPISFGSNSLVGPCLLKNVLRPMKVLYIITVERVFLQQVQSSFREVAYNTEHNRA